jgi:2'-5' RNA ligase
VTVGVTVDVPEPWRSELREVRLGSGDPLAEIVPPHLTLLSPTAVVRGDFETLIKHLNAVAVETASFKIVLHGVASFMPLAPVAYVPVIDGGGACAALAAAILGGPVPLKQKYPFHPHVTVAQNVDTAAMERACRSLMEFEAVIPVEGCVLSISDDPPCTPAAAWHRYRELAFTG